MLLIHQFGNVFIIMILHKNCLQSISLSAFKRYNQTYGFMVILVSSCISFLIFMVLKSFNFDYYQMLLVI